MWEGAVGERTPRCPHHRRVTLMVRSKSERTVADLFFLKFLKFSFNRGTLQEIWRAWPRFWRLAAWASSPITTSRRVARPIASCGARWRRPSRGRGCSRAMWYKYKYVDDLNAMPAELLKAERGSQ